MKIRLLKERLNKKEGLNRSMKIRELKEKFDTEQVAVTSVDWRKLQKLVNSILRKNGKDFYVEFHSANSKHLANPYDVFISVYESETGEVIDDEKLSARYYPSGDVIFVFGGFESRELTSPEEVAENISDTVEDWYKKWSR